MDNQTLDKYEVMTKLYWEYVKICGLSLYTEFFDYGSFGFLDEKIEAFEHCIKTKTMELPISIMEKYPKDVNWDVPV